MMKISGITIERFCDFHQVERKQVLAFIDFGLIKAEHQNQLVVIPDEEVEYLERCLRLSNELGVNLEGLEIIGRMRKRMVQMQNELDRLRQLTGGVEGETFFDDKIEFFIDRNS